MTRLNKTQWLDHGLRTLTAQGFTALKADKLAKSLGVSRGSFYWHFQDLAAYHKAILAHWQEKSVQSVIEQIEQEPDPRQKLEQLINFAAETVATLATESAVRAWANNSDEVREFVYMIDVARLTYLEQLLGEIDLPVDVIKPRARIIYTSYLGQMLFAPDATPEQNSQLSTELIRLTTG